MLLTDISFLYVVASFHSEISGAHKLKKIKPAFLAALSYIGNPCESPGCENNNNNIIRGKNGQSDSSFTAGFVYGCKQAVFALEMRMYRSCTCMALAKIMGAFLLLSM